MGGGRLDYHIIPGGVFIIQLFEKQGGREILDPKKPGRSFFYPSSHAIGLNAHQTKLLEELFHGNS